MQVGNAIFQHRFYLDIVVIVNVAKGPILIMPSLIEFWLGRMLNLYPQTCTLQGFVAKVILLCYFGITCSLLEREVVIACTIILLF